MEQNKFLNRSFVNVINVKILRILKDIVNSSVEILYRLALSLLLVVYDCFFRISIVLDNIYWSYKDLACAPRSTECSQLRSYLQESKKEFRKIPNHLVLILGPEKPSHDDLAKIISWSEPLGIKFISFYDHKNGVEPVLVFEAVKKSYKHIIHKIKWGKSFSDDVKQASIKQINGYRWEGLLRVNILDQGDSNLELIEAAKELHSSCDHSTPVDQSTLSRLLESRLGAPSPDLAIVCGPVLSYFACSPWHLRLTQFVHIQSHHSLKVSKFLNCLHQYSNSEQRFGK